MTLIEARTEGEEALAIALALREAIERPGATAALVTPDRALARRVSVELSRRGLVVDDSAGVPLARTPPAVLARLVAEVAVSGFDTVALVALLQHPLAAFGMTRARARRQRGPWNSARCAGRGRRPARPASHPSSPTPAMPPGSVGSGGGTRTPAGSSPTTGASPRICSKRSSPRSPRWNGWPRRPAAPPSPASSTPMSPR